jgi:hypothetical protein
VATEIAAAINKLKGKKRRSDKAAAGKAYAPLEGAAGLGVERIHDYLTHEGIRDLIGDAKAIKILKTWFPESKQIAHGLKRAVQNPAATVQLLLCKPGSVILKERSLSADEDEWWGAVTVYHAIKNVHRWLISKPAGANVQIACYDSWPGCPVIWYDDVILMGFYFRGESSPDWPWLRVRPGKRLAAILDKQFDELWNHPDTCHLDTLEQIERWLSENEKWEMHRVGPRRSAKSYWD